MARKPTVRYFPSRGAYYCQLDGQQHKLAVGPDDSPTGPTYLAALDAYSILLRRAAVGTAGMENTVRDIVEKYLDVVEEKAAPATYLAKRHYLRVLTDHQGETRCSALKPIHLEEIISLMRKPRANPKKGFGAGPRVFQWGNTSAHDFLIHSTAAFNWAVRKGLLPSNPISRIEIPAARSHARERIITPEQHKQLLLILDTPRARPLRDLIMAFESTGARPGELYNATVGDFNPALKAIVYYQDDHRREDEFRHKTAAYKDRVIYLTGEVLDLVRQRAAKAAPASPLFPTYNGNFYAADVLGRGFRRLRDRLGIPGFVPYFYRHTFATRFLSDGGSIDILAALLGNTPDTIRKHYSHLISDHEAVRAKLEAFRSRAAHGGMS